MNYSKIVEAVIDGGKTGFSIMVPVVQSMVIIIFLLLQTTIMNFALYQMSISPGFANHEYISVAESVFSVACTFTNYIALMSIALLILSAINIAGPSRKEGILGLYRSRNILIWTMMAFWYAFVWAFMIMGNGPIYYNLIFDIGMLLIIAIIAWPILSNTYDAIVSLKPIIKLLIKPFKGAKA